MNKKAQMVCQTAKQTQLCDQSIRRLRRGFSDNMVQKDKDTKDKLRTSQIQLTGNIQKLEQKKMEEKHFSKK